eukprot:TRINITY_DN19049_c0_g2_i2.p1 TRINITY_DN19049_c0_g2~~TRINITY_DN19049_c0_g2_i2.p1  ORF type:complete len:1031 (+),score=209.74 TRINITY_DN19049_c0_g2_i2:87-3095(+)
MASASATPSHSKLKYKVVKCTSEDPDHLVQELLSTAPQSGGWQTKQFCEYPQEIGLQFEGLVHLRQVQFLSHQSKIATKIELFTAQPPRDASGGVPPYGSIQFKRLGYLSLDSNERSQYQARELKSVYVDIPCQFLRILFHKCHVNRLNAANQVGLISLTCLGDALEGPPAMPAPAPALGATAPGAVPARPALEKPQIATPTATPVQTPTAVRSQPSTPGTQAQASPQSQSLGKAGLTAARSAGPAPSLAAAAPPPLQPTTPQANPQDVSAPSSIDAKALERIEALTEQKQKAVDCEDYAEAKRCKELIDKLKQSGEKLKDLEQRKKAAVENEDYDLAKNLKIDIDNIRALIEGRPPTPSTTTNGMSSRPPSISSGPSSVVEEPKAPARRTSPSAASSPAPSKLIRQPIKQPATLGGAGVSRGAEGGSHGDEARPKTSGPPSPAVSRQPTTGGQSMQATRSSPTARQQGTDATRTSLRGSAVPPPTASYAPGVASRDASASLGSAARISGDAAGGLSRERRFSPATEDPYSAGQSTPTPSAASGAPPPRGGHPLAGVPNFEELPEPAPLAPGNDKAMQITPLLGEYVTQCIFSKQWNLRDAAVQKITLDLREGAYESMEPTLVLRALAVVLAVIIPDKNVQVFLASGHLMQALCQQTLAPAQMRKQEVHAMVDPIMPLLVLRLGEANARVEKTSRDALLDFSASPCVGAAFAAQHLLKAPSQKTVAPRVYSSRLQLLTALVTSAGIEPDSRDGLPLDPTVQLAMDWFNNPAAEVRENAVKLVGAIYLHVGLGRIKRYLANLRQAQREVFDAEFERVSGGDAEHDAAPPMAPTTSSSSQRGGFVFADIGPPSRTAGGPDPYSSAPAAVAAGSEVCRRVSRTTSNGSQAASQASDYGYGGGAIPEFTCMFCRREDPAFTPRGLDMHYWKECPMLFECEFCEQVVEISELRVHLLEECDSPEPAVAAARHMLPNHCPLCHMDLGAAKDRDWRHHLLVVGCSGGAA